MAPQAPLVTSIYGRLHNKCEDKCLIDAFKLLICEILLRLDIYAIFFELSLKIPLRVI